MRSAAGKRIYTDWTVIERQAARMNNPASRANRAREALRAKNRTPWEEDLIADFRRDARSAASEYRAVVTQNSAAPVQGHEPDAELRGMADRRAELMSERIGGLDAAMQPESLLAIINGWLDELQARAFEPVKRWAGKLAGVLKRVQCRLWWRRQLRGACVRLAESAAVRSHRVSAKAGQWYCSDDTVRRRILQGRRNASILESTILENDEGDEFTLKALADKGTGNKAIRRGELMTRIRGCEEWADAAGHVGLFLTLTAPSRFHATSYETGRENPHYKGGTPRDAQDWLCTTWARARAALARLDVVVYGFRVAEPHHDGCPHWHALLWVESERDSLLLLSTLWAYWLADGGDEKGAEAHRVKAVRMVGGMASGYVAKYIAKNIDDAGSVGDEGHRDEWAGEGAELQRELWANPAQRVEAWAAAWRIRQFQAIGQPPVTVWRELRRVPSEAAELAPVRVSLALEGVSRFDEQRACWATYLHVQGGTNTGRDYAIRVALKREEFEGRYETTEKALPLGVYETGKPDVLVPSLRRKWKPRGAWGARGRACVSVRACAEGFRPEGHARSAGAPPWTRVNNCTQGGRVNDSIRGNMGQVLADLQARNDRERAAVPFEVVNDRAADDGTPPKDWTRELFALIDRVNKRCDALEARAERNGRRVAVIEDWRDGMGAWG